MIKLCCQAATGTNMGFISKKFQIVLVLGIFLFLISPPFLYASPFDESDISSPILCFENIDQDDPRANLENEGEVFVFTSVVDETSENHPNRVGIPTFFPRTFSFDLRSMVLRC